jgi:hypothetical protein
MGYVVKSRGSDIPIYLIVGLNRSAVAGPTVALF